MLSIIIPAYNEEHRLPGTLTQIIEYLKSQPYCAEIIVVENGSTDDTVGVAQRFTAEHSHVRLIRSVQRGKGIATRLGMLAAGGQYCFMCDADLSMPITEVAKFLPPKLNSYDIAIGSREAPGSHRFGEPAYRHLMGRVYATIVKILALPGFEDTQCGFKSFRREVARDLFASQSMQGWGFDPELLYIARKRHYKIVEVPIDWYYNADSRVSPIKDAIQMVRDLLRIRWNDLRGKYQTSNVKCQMSNIK
ncbi:MAG: glycosyl transferase [Chloroflexi bacterium RBG_16_57_9]|nr:MAG: glycosyl transferase [Chloroflexi bacterium RBG_16_57_9]